ncbi:glucose 1-dehydrogenase [Pseudacidovorax intermedius]|uniref:3-oxoacyl-ACP reductase n=1 Tax=Pseudacidovorax intermedius TaxID=433924 RepID=A0A147GPF6_9BURK|nr:glucose 1-dehydrogenase [Pseudacidovorax intermedius]KTT16253.1 3-oxoacyl-ACP reductase [Pseudacidovorax intermedius]
MTNALSGKVAVVTGGARGIGLGIARRLTQDGARVALWDLGFDGFSSEPAGFVPALTQSVDVSNFASVEQAYADTVQALGQVDILVNNAGINGPVVNMWDYPVETWDKVMGVNLAGVFYCTRVMVPAMRERKQGRIVNISSMAGKEGAPGIAAYAAAKGGVISFTKTVARELCDSGVMVNAVAPAMTETDLFRQMTPEHIANMKSRIPMGRFVQVDDVAATVAFIVGPDCSFTTGFTFDVSGGRAVY